MNLKEALASLDVTNDEHWTQDDLPRLDVLKDLVGKSVSRADIAKVAKAFNRHDTTIDDAAPVAEPQGAPVAPKADTSDFEKGHAQAEAELAAARKALDEAKSNYKVAQEKADAYRVIKDKQTAAVPLHNIVQAYQKAQQEQRKKEVEQIAALRELTKGFSAEQLRALNAK